jgi:hypothetical protein
MFTIKLSENEKLLGMFRQSLWVLSKPFFITFVLSLIPIYLLQKYELFSEFWKILVGWLSILFCYLLYKIILWFFSVLFITQHRLIYIKLGGFFKKTLTDPEIKNISHISVETNILKKAFDLKDLNVTIFGNFELLKIPNLTQAETIKDLILKQKQLVWQSKETIVK